MVQTTIHGDQVEVIADNRPLDDIKAERLELLRQLCSGSIEAAGVDEFDQRNAALGVLDETRTTEITTVVTDNRQKYLTKKAEVEAATDVAAVEAVMW